MRAGALVIVLGLLPALVAGGTFATHSTTAQLDTPVVAACSVQGESCKQPSLGGGRQFVIRHNVLAGGCPRADLHVLRYVSSGETAGGQLIASWCSQ